MYWYNLAAGNATVAQLVEQTLRKRQVMGSTPIGGSEYNAETKQMLGLFSFV